MPRKAVVFHRGGIASPWPRGKNAFAHESAQATRRVIWGGRYSSDTRWGGHAVIRNPRMKPLIHKGRKP